MIETVAERETGIYIVCSDQELMNSINQMLKRQGIIGVMDTVGRMHYVVDARQNAGYAARRIADFLNTNTIGNSFILEYDSDNQISEPLLRIVIVETLRGYGFDLSLIGTKAIAILISAVIRCESYTSLTSKELFCIAADALNLTYSQLERDIRYALKKSQYRPEGKRSSNIVRVLIQEVRERVYSNPALYEKTDKSIIKG